MNPKEKAKQLVEKYSSYSIGDGKKCALVCVEEILEPLKTLHKPEYTSFISKNLYTIPETEYDTHIHGYELIEYFEEVKEELLKL